MTYNELLQYGDAFDRLAFMGFFLFASLSNSWTKVYPDNDLFNYAMAIMVLVMQCVLMVRKRLYELTSTRLDTLAVSLWAVSFAVDIVRQLREHGARRLIARLRKAH